VINDHCHADRGRPAKQGGEADGICKGTIHMKIFAACAVRQETCKRRLEIVINQ